MGPKIRMAKKSHKKHVSTHIISQICGHSGYLLWVNLSTNLLTLSQDDYIKMLGIGVGLFVVF